MSDFTEYYKKAWELGLVKQTEEIAVLKSKLSVARDALVRAHETSGMYEPIFFAYPDMKDIALVADQALKEIGEL